MSLSALALALATGASIGSFLNVCADRLPEGRSVVHGRSRCDSCLATLQPVDLVPVFSYLWLRGRCRHCGARIAGRLPVVELLAALSFGLIWYQAAAAAGAVPQAIIDAVECSLLILVAVIDLDRQLILNKIIYPWVPIAFGLAALSPRIGPLNSAIGGALAFVVFVAVYVLSAGGIGFGDVKLAGIVGLMLGFPSVLVALFAAFVSGGMVAAVFLLTGKKGRKDALPFGVFLSLGAIIALLWGGPVWSWYLRWLV